MSRRCLVAPFGNPGSMACASGSPKRQLNSRTYGVPSRASITPAYSTPSYGAPWAAISRSTGTNTSRRTRARGVRGRLPRGAHHDTLPGGEPRRLHDERLGVRADVLEGGGEVGKGGARGRGHARAAHHFFGVGLRRLEPGGGLARPEHRAIRRAQAIGETGGQ